MDTDTVLATVTRAGSTSQRPAATEQGQGAPAVSTGARPDRRDPMVRAEALSLGALLQAPDAIRAVPSALQVADDLVAEAFAVPQYRAVFSAIAAAGGVRAAGKDWVAQVIQEAGDDLAGIVNELAVTPLPHDKADTLGVYGGSVMGKVLEGHLTRGIGELRGAMQRAGAGTDEAQKLFAEMIAMEAKRRSLRGD